MIIQTRTNCDDAGLDVFRDGLHVHRRQSFSMIVSYEGKDGNDGKNPAYVQVGQRIDKAGRGWFHGMLR